jgi:outer membrane receptor for ferrienterochelin and colicin
MQYSIVKCLLIAGVATLASALGTSAFAQGVTTSGIAGFVLTQQGAPAAGAKVLAVHVASGTRYAATTSAGGEFTFSGLRPGGPYSVTVTATGYGPETKTDINLNAGEVAKVDFSLSSEVVKMEAVTVSAPRDTTFDVGLISNAVSMSSADISEIMSIRRDIQDFQNLDPRANMMQVSPTDTQFTVSFAGQNPRENLLLIDGVSATDNFGLNSNGYAGFRNPVPPEWIDSLTIDLNPYDLIYSGFSGGVTNVSLKSGTNSYHGSVYEIYTGTNFRGPDPVVGLLGKHEPLNEHTTGIEASGPIIKNKLFFFIGYDAFREIASPPVQNFLPDDSVAGATATLGGTQTQGIIDQIIAKSESAYGFNPGTLLAVNHIWEQNFVAKIDWNISDAQKFEFTFRHTAGEAPNFYNYTSSFETSLSSSWYNTYRTDQSYTAKLNSDWSSFIQGLQTEVEATYKRYNGTARLSGADYPAVQIDGIPGVSIAGGSAPYELFLGQYWAYQDNNIYTWEQEEHAYGVYSIGNHTLKFGAQFDRTGYTDTFIPNILGTYDFATVQQFLNGTPTYVQQESPYPGYTLGSDVSHYYSMDIAPLIEDTWRPTENLTVMGGIRMDYPYEPQRPPFSPLFYNTYGYRNNTTGNGNYVVQPRIGFSYNLPKAITERKTQIRGGWGLVEGSNAVVWYENAFNNAGQLNTVSTGSTSSSATTKPILSGTYHFTGNPSPTLIGLVPPSSAVPSFDIINPNFKTPSNWKENLAIDHELPWWHMIFTASVDLSQVNQDVKLYQLNYQTATSGPAFMPDGAIRYAGNITTAESVTTYGSGYSSAYTTSSSPTYLFNGTTSTSSSVLQANKATGPVYELTDTDKGGSQEYMLSIHRPVIDGWGFEIAYVHTHATQVDPSPSSVASSGYSDLYGVNPNDNIPYRSEYAVPDKVVVSASKVFKFFHKKDTETTLTAQFLTQTGQAYSYVFKGDANGSGIGNASLMYVPTGGSDPNVTWASTTDEQNFFAWLSQNPDLEKYEGKIAPRNAFYAPWQKTVNLHLEQNIPMWRVGHFVLFADCFNFANLFARHWGIVDNWDNSFNVRSVVGTGYNAAGNGGAGQYIYVYNPGTIIAPTIYPDMSRWSVQIGGRYQF